MLENEDLALINNYSTREMTESEIYSFKVTLCDNDIDRDFERFTPEALQELSQLFIGKTGIYDHDPKGKNQWARIYKTAVITDNERITKTGEPYMYLQAHAYMVRTAASEELISEIEAGIKKEVSIGCKMGRMTCSICGTDRVLEPCAHQPGGTYQGKLCYVSLDMPQDAYEFSFVAVPAQKNAGITKSFTQSSVENVENLCQKLFDTGAQSVLSANELSVVQKEFERIKAYSVLGERYITSLQSELIRTAAMCEFPMEPGTLKEMSMRMSADQLTEMCGAVKKFAADKQLKRQLSPYRQSCEQEQNGAFKV